VTVTELDRLIEPEARRVLGHCCGARRWVDAMLAARPFADRAGLMDAADRADRMLGRDDWLEAFAQHPRIGDFESLRTRFGTAADWSRAEQRDARDAGERTLHALADGNRDYERRFGHLFIVCATGRSAEEMLAMLRERLAHDPDLELEVAAGEQSRITRLRLDRLIGLDPAAPGGDARDRTIPGGAS
jgi:2-oxo-4-hydroxy-4-carboxy-5-ureidoimidazoline decarboxylase